MLSLKNIIQTLSVLVIFIASTGALAKPLPSGIIDLPGAIDAKNPIGGIADHPWRNENVDGVRIRTSWANTELADGVYNWVQIDECLANAATSGKFIGLGVISGLEAPPWLMGGVSFSDGSTTFNVARLRSETPNAFLATDVGRVIVCANFPPGTTILSRISPTVVQTSAAATKTTTEKLVAFSILARHPGGASFRVLTAPDEGVIPVPWDPFVKAKWKRFIRALGARYDSSPRFRYLVMSGFQKTGECYLATVNPDIKFFNSSAVAAGYAASESLPAGMVAWEETVKEIVDTYMRAFPTTSLLITLAKPFPSEHGGVLAMNDIVAWGTAKYPGRFGLMNSQLHATSTIGYFANARIYENRLSEPTGIQFLCNSVLPENVRRLSNCGRYGPDPCLTAYDAMNNSLKAAVNIGCRFVEVYEPDVMNRAYQAMLAHRRADLKANP